MMNIGDSENTLPSIMYRRVIGVLLILLICAVGAGIYFFREAAVTPEARTRVELEKTVSLVGRLMVLPEGEIPTIATVSDPEKLQGQAFFAHAQKGDVVLVYALAKKAILYSPTLNKILEIAPVSPNGAGEQTNASLL